MATEHPATEVVAKQIRTALNSADLTELSHLLDPQVQWGAPDAKRASCQNREQVLTWYRKGRANGVRARVTEMVVRNDKILVGLKMAGDATAAEAGDEANRWQILTLAAGRIVDIRGFEDRAEAASRLGPPC
jgi:ketosteroid isomerase-like protein